MPGNEPCQAHTGLGTHKIKMSLSEAPTSYSLAPPALPPVSSSLITYDQPRAQTRCGIGFLPQDPGEPAQLRHFTNPENNASVLLKAIFKKDLFIWQSYRVGEGGRETFHLLVQSLNDHKFGLGWAWPNPAASSQ